MMIDVKEIRHELRVLLHHIKLSMRRMAAKRKVMITSMLGMLINNLLFFVTWILIFQLVPHLKGWTLSDVAMMYGLGATCFGLAGAFFGGFRMLADDVDSGKFDSYMCKPASTFTLAVTSNSTPHAWGDAITGPVFWLIFCHLSVVQVVLLSLMSIAGAIICMAVGVAIYSMAFWASGTRNHADAILYWTVSFLTTPLHGLPYWMKMVLFTILPMGFVSYLPVQMIREPSILTFLSIFVGAIWALVLARVVFYLGLRQYKGVSSIRTGG